WNGYGAPRVPREYCPSSLPSLNVASSFVPYSSKLKVSAPLANCPVVDVTLSSPLKNDPFGVAHAAPPQTISKRKGMSTRTGSAPAGAVLTSTDASHNPAGELCAAESRASPGARLRPIAATNAHAIEVRLFMHMLPKNERARLALRLPSPCRLVNW